MQNPQLTLKLPNHLCEEIFNSELQIQIGNVTETLIAKTIELYVEAMSIYMNYAANTENVALSNVSIRGHQYYQEKIKKLLLRKDVQKCLLGYKSNPKTINLQLELSRVQQSAPQQAKALIKYYKKYHREQEDFIRKTLQQQNNQLQQRIARRSRSRSNGTVLKENISFHSNFGQK